MPNLDYVQWDITAACNLKCLHCREKATLTDTKDNLSTEQCHALINQVVAYNTHTLSIAGGEPLMARTIWDTLAYAAGKFKRLVISTNGTLLDGPTAARLAEFVTNCQVSIDGATEQTHDVMRGKGNFRRAIAGIKHLQDAGVKVGIRLTLHRGNMHEVLQYVDLAAELGLPDAYLRRVILSGNAKKYDLQPLSPEELRDAIGGAIEHGKSLGLHVASADYFAKLLFAKILERKQLPHRQ